MKLIVLQTEGLTKVYDSRGRVTTKALSNFSFEVKKGEFVGIMGPSGSGKTTLLNLLATIDRPTSGRVLIEGVDTSALKGDKLAEFRRRRLGFVFQDFNLLDTLTIGENISLPLVLDRRPVAFIKERVREVAHTLGITAILPKYPHEVSGGQQQRAAAARAIVHQPALLLADEPTGNLDSKAARELMEMLYSSQRKPGRHRRLSDPRSICGELLPADHLYQGRAALQRAPPRREPPTLLSTHSRRPLDDRG